jgi:hypothetical protein
MMGKFLDKYIVAPLNDKRLAVPLTVLLILYSGFLAGSPSPVLRQLLREPLVRVLAIFVLAVLTAKGDRQLAVMSTVAVVLTLAATTQMNLVDDLVGSAQRVVTTTVDVAGDVVDAVVPKQQPGGGDP